MTTTIIWHDAKTELPAKSGLYLAVPTTGRMEVLPYTTKHSLFNAYDWNHKKRAESLAVDVKYWAIIPDFPDDESEGVDNG